MMKMLQTVSKTYLAQTLFLFHCNIKIKVPVEFGELFLDECFEILEQIDLKYNSYQSGSYFQKINKNAGSWTEVDENCIEILKTLRFISECTNGAYDISCAPLLHLWGFYRKENLTIPTQNEINETLERVDFRAIEFEENKVRIPKDFKLITGSFIKSFAVDELVKFLKEKGVTDAIINAGGSTIFGLNDETHSTWKINLPNMNEGEKQISISNECFCLSAISNNHIIINEKKYGHILNAVTGYPANSLQVGVWSKNAFVADVVSTALFVVDKNDLEETVERLKTKFEFDYFRIEQNGEKTTSKCF